MSLTLHWFLPTNGDSRNVVGGGHGANAANWRAAACGTALVGSHDEVAERILEYHELGIDDFVRSGYPHLAEAYWFGEGVPPRSARGLWRHPDAPVVAHRGLEVASF